VCHHVVAAAPGGRKGHRTNMNKLITTLLSVTGAALIATGCGSSGGSSSPTEAPPTETAPVVASTGGDMTGACPQNTVKVLMGDLTWLDNGGAAVELGFQNTCDRPQRPTSGSFLVEHIMPDGSAKTIAREVGFVMDGSTGQDAVPFIAPGETIGWTLSWERLYLDLEYALAKPDLDPADLRIKFNFAAQTQS